MAENQALSPPARPRLPYLLWFLGLHMLLGAAIGVAFVSLILLANVAGLRDLIAASREPFLPLFLLYTFHMLTFASVTMGVAVMGVPWSRR